MLSPITASPSAWWHRPPGALPGLLWLRGAGEAPGRAVGQTPPSVIARPYR